MIPDCLFLRLAGQRLRGSAKTHWTCRRDRTALRGQTPREVHRLRAGDTGVLDPTPLRLWESTTLTVRWAIGSVSSTSSVRGTCRPTVEVALGTLGPSPLDPVDQVAAKRHSRVTCPLTAGWNLWRSASRSSAIRGVPVPRAVSADRYGHEPDPAFPNRMWAAHAALSRIACTSACSERLWLRASRMSARSVVGSMSLTRIEVTPTAYESTVPFSGLHEWSSCSQVESAAATHPTGSADSL